MEEWLNQSYEQGLVSVIIPCHNVEQFLPTCLESVNDQDYRPLEVIIVDDGSSDRTSQIMSNFQSTQKDGLVVKCFYQLKQGAPHARNVACRQSQGEFIQFLDGDDILCSNKLSEQVAIFKNDSEVDVVYGDGQYLIINRGGDGRKGRVISIGHSSDIIESMLTGAWVPVFSYLSRRSSVQRCGPWDIKIKINQDYEYFLRMAMQGCRFYYKTGITGLYRKHSLNSISEQSISLRGRTRQVILTKAELFLREKGEFKENRILAMAENYRRIARSVYPMDMECFKSSLDYVLKIYPNYRPRGRKARLISSIMGFRNYEKVAAIINRMNYKTRVDWF